MAFSESKGPPGANLVIKNVTVAITQSVGIAWSNREKMSFVTEIPPGSSRHICMDDGRARLGAIHERSGGAG